VNYNPLHFQQIKETESNSICSLSGTILSGLDLLGADLRYGTLIGANLSGVKLNESHLGGCDSVWSKSRRSRPVPEQIGSGIPKQIFMMRVYQKPIWI
jgi:hypothetical protein